MTSDRPGLTSTYVLDQDGNDQILVVTDFEIDTNNHSLEIFHDDDEPINFGDQDDGDKRNQW